MFDILEMAPPDAILGLTEAFKNDSNPDKVNLSVGVYKDAAGGTPILECVRAAERQILESEESKTYVNPNSGTPQYTQAVRELLFGKDHDLVGGGRAITAHTPGGTGALRVAGDYLHLLHGSATLWLSDPTWANHAGVFKAAGMQANTYPYFDAATNVITVDKMIDKIKTIPPGDVVLLHGCCHNPTGADLTSQQWETVAETLKARQLVPLIDFAYQGFSVGIEEDAAGLRIVCELCSEVMICSSFSKNFGLYNERVGALTVVAGSSAAADKVLSHIKRCIRTNYSNPPAHGSAIVSTVLGDSQLRQQWIQEVENMRDRINTMRQQFADSLANTGVSLSNQGNAFITQQNGMFSFSGLSKDQVGALRDRHAVYVVGDGRINIAGLTETNIPFVSDAIAQVVGA